MDSTAILMGIGLTMGREAGMQGCSFDEASAATVRELFGLTVDPAVQADASVWDDPRKRRFVHRKAAEIAREASAVALRHNQGVITPAILDEVALLVFAEARAVWERAARMAGDRPGWEIFAGGSLFCGSLPQS